MAERIPLAFLAGLISIAFPCVLPLVPGYLSAVSDVEVGRFGERGVARRVVVASLPFALGFTVVFVVLGAGAAAIGGALSSDRQSEVAGFVLVVLGLAFAGLLPWPEQMFAPTAANRARASGSRVLLGGAFALCAAPCVGITLAAILALAADSRTVVRGIVLLAAYSLGITAAFVLIGIAFTRAMSAFRWVRDHYAWIRIASGLTLVVLGLLLFFHRDWWLNVLLHRALEAIGLGQL
jgi:cytochrome c-type biogenesis protein